MSSSTLRKLAVALATAALGLLTLAGSSQGAAETGTFGPFQESFTETLDQTGTCLGAGATGTISGTETVVGHFTENGPPAFGFHDHGTATSDFRISYSDGRYLLSTEVVHFNDNATHSDQFTSTAVTKDAGTLYDAAGQLLGTVTFHAVFHITYRDANGNHQPDAGEITASVDRYRLTCP